MCIPKFINPILKPNTILYNPNTSPDISSRNRLVSRMNDLAQAKLRNVVELELKLMLRSKHSDCACEEVGFWLSNFLEMQHPRIRLDFPLRIPNFQCFHNLKKFHIELRWADNELTSKLFTSLPKLEELYVSIWYSVTNCREFNIIVPVLKVLEFHVSGQCWIVNMDVMIDVPMLKDISISDDSLYSYTFRNISSEPLTTVILTHPVISL